MSTLVEEIAFAIDDNFISYEAGPSIQHTCTVQSNPSIKATKWKQKRDCCTQAAVIQ